MNLAFERGYLRDNDDKAIKELPVEFHPTSMKDAYGYIKTHRTVPYFSVNFKDDLDVLAVDFGSHTEFCYIWGLTEENKREFMGRDSIKSKVSDEETEKRKFAYDVLYRIKQMNTIPYDVAVAFSKILGDK